MTDDIRFTAHDMARSKLVDRIQVTRFALDRAREAYSKGQGSIVEVINARRLVEEAEDALDNFDRNGNA